MSNSFLGIIYFIACSHAFMLSVSLYLRATRASSAAVNNATATRLLSVLCALIAYKLFEGGALYTKAYTHLAHAMDLLPGEVLFFGPLYFLYIAKMSGQQPFSSPKWLLHFLPAAMIWLYNSASVFTPTANKIAMWDNVLASTDSGPIAIQWVILLLAIKAHLATYLLLSWKRIDAMEQTIDDLRSDDSHLALKKMRITVLAFLALEITWVTLFLGKQFFALGTLNMVSEIWLLFVALMVLALGFLGLQNPKLVFDQEERTLAEKSMSEKQGLANQVLENNTQHPSESQKGSQLKRQKKNVKYIHSALPESTLHVLALELESRLKEQQLFLDSDLTITQLSKSTGIRSHTLSQVITQAMNTNFYKLINSYRVQHAVGLIEDKNINWSLERIALESGFGNRVTFSKSFKEIMSCTPSAYKKQIAQAS